MSIQQQRKSSISKYIINLQQLVEELHLIMLEKPQYIIDQHVKKLRDRLDEISNL